MSYVDRYHCVRVHFVYEVYTSCVQRVWVWSVMGVVCIVWAVWFECEHPSILLSVKLLSVKCRPVSLCVCVCIHSVCVQRVGTDVFVLIDDVAPGDARACTILPLKRSLDALN